MYTKYAWQIVLTDLMLKITVDDIVIGQYLVNLSNLLFILNTGVSSGISSLCLLQGTSLFSRIIAAKS